MNELADQAQLASRPLQAPVICTHAPPLLLLLLLLPLLPLPLQLLPLPLLLLLLLLLLPLQSAASTEGCYACASKPHAERLTFFTFFKNKNISPSMCMHDVVI